MVISGANRPEVDLYDDTLGYEDEPRVRTAPGLSDEEIEALGAIETYSASSIIEVADAAAKAAQVTLFRVHLAMAIGGKGLVVMTGEVAAVHAAVDAGAAVAAESGILVNKVVIPGPRRELFNEFI